MHRLEHVGMSLETWRAGFAAEDQCVWPGPRPLTDDDPDRWLAGRDHDVVQFMNRLKANRLIFVSAGSGVGKTSILSKGVIPTLRANGLVPVLCREWGGSASASNPAEFLAPRIHDQIGDPSLPRDATLFHELESRYGANLVLVLDQFEELIRDSPTFKEQVFDLVTELNRAWSMRVVISLRSEYLYDLQALERRVDPYSLDHFYLDEISDSFGADVVLSGNDAQGPQVVDASVANVIADAWRSGRLGATATPGAPRVGLLHLQAFLYVLHDRVKGSQIDAAAVHRLIAELNSSGGDPAGTAAGGVFQAALGAAVDVKLSRCRLAAVGLDEHLVAGTADLVARSTRHLSSGGYKLVRTTNDLATETLNRELNALRRAIARARRDDADLEATDGVLSGGQSEALLRVMTRTITDGVGDADLLLAEQELLAALADSECPEADVPWANRLHAGGSLAAVDPGGATCGPMMGASPSAVFIEEMRRFVFALEWLQASSLVRLNYAGGSDTVVALIHDGFGPALDQWAAERSGLPAAQLTLLTSLVSEELVWVTGPDEVLPEFDGRVVPTGVRYFANVRWRGAYVRASFRGVVFANGDFRGTFFERCVFEDVTFLNCLLDGAMFTDCTVVGDPAPFPALPSEEFSRRFILPDVPELTSALALYRDLPPGPKALVCDLPGAPVKAVPAADVPASARAFEPPGGGLVVQGGRLSSLTIRSLDFVDGGEVALREAAGSGLDIVDHDSVGAYEITCSALRHVTFTRSPLLEDQAQDSGELTITVDNSALYQLWLGHGLNGALRVTNSQIVQAWNGSDGIVATAADCRHHGLVGFASVDGTSFEQDGRSWAIDELDAGAVVRSKALSMDYRTDATRKQLTEL